ncbi:MAG TPA: MFS transporter, partial [Oceanospirillales bacterium]|nr:MFS transporter [Oceanospirillales bacterium]
SVAGASLAGRFAAVTVQRYGILLFALSLGGLLLAMQAASLPAFLVASALAGSAQGAVLSASIRTMVSELDISQRADVLSVIYITSYSGAAIPTLIAGQLSGIFDLLQLASGYALLALAGTLFVFIATRNQTRHSTESQEQVHEGLS